MKKYDEKKMYNEVKDQHIIPEKMELENKRVNTNFCYIIISGKYGLLTRTNRDGYSKMYLIEIDRKNEKARIIKDFFYKSNKRTDDINTLARSYKNGYKDQTFEKILEFISTIR